MLGGGLYSTDHSEDRKPRVGQPLTYRGEHIGTVRRVEGNLCVINYADGSEPSPFIWRFHDGLNTMFDWPTKEGK